MILIFNLLEDYPEEVVQSRYKSDDNPYISVTEIIHVLQSVFYDSNQASNAWAELAELMWKPKTDITKFIFKLTNLADLADLANIPTTDCKALL
jgi:type II secretory pathway pseudopilin PulG